MEPSSQIRNLLRSIAGVDKPTFDFRLMEVVEVDKDLCRARLGDLEIPGIRLSSIEGGAEQGLLVTPKVGSTILVADISCGNLRELCVIAYSEIESVRFHQGKTTVTANGSEVTVAVGGSSVKIEEESVMFNDGSNNGMVKVEELKRSLESLKDYCETLKRAVSTGLNAVGASTAANGATGAAAFDTEMAAATIQIEELENDKVKH